MIWRRAPRTWMRGQSDLIATGEQREGGPVLLAVLLFLTVVAGSAVTFIWHMNRQQIRAGRDY